jgi:ParB family chromosome partitioning protein
MEAEVVVRGSWSVTGCAVADQPVSRSYPVTSTMDLPTQRDTDEVDTMALSDPTVVAAPDRDNDTSEEEAIDQASDGSDNSDDATSGDIPLEDLSDKELTALHEQWDTEINTVLLADPHRVLIAENVRTDNAAADEETTANFRAHGVKTATNGYRDYDTGAIVVTEGQRRVLNAREAGCSLPVWMKTPPPADERKATIERIVNQIIENDIRARLTLGDTARGLQQLAAFNLTPTGIARKLALGKKGKAYVENVLQAGQSELAVKATERFQLDLIQAAVIAEFDNAGDLDTAKELICIARESPNNFGVVAERKRAERAENERFAALAEVLTQELTAADVTIFDDSLSVYNGDSRSLDRLRPTAEDEPHTELTAQDHVSCPGHGAWIDDEYDQDDKRVPVAIYGCADFRAHGHALSHAPAGRVDLTPLVTGPMTVGTAGEVVDLDTLGDQTPDSKEDEAEAARAALAAEERAREAARIIRRWVIQNNKDWDAAETPRREWLAGFALRKTAPQGAQLFLALQKARGGYELRRAFERNHSLARELLGLPIGSTLADLTDKITTAPTAGKATLYDVFLTLCAIEADLSRNTWRNPWGSAKEYMAAITSWGYPASDVELMVLNPHSEQDVVAAQLGELDSAAPVGDDIEFHEHEDEDSSQPDEDTETGDTDRDGQPTDAEPDRVEADDAPSPEGDDAIADGIADEEVPADEKKAIEPDAVDPQLTRAAI